jgi:hypothetical protein
VSALALAAVGSLKGESGITLSADLLVAVELLRNGGNSGIHGATTKSKHEMQGGLFLDVVVGKTAAICVRNRSTFELLASEDETLLIGRDAFLVLDLSLDSLDRVRGLNIESDGLARKGLHEYLHD